MRPGKAVTCGHDDGDHGDDDDEDVVRAYVVEEVRTVLVRVQRYLVLVVRDLVVLVVDHRRRYC